MIGKIKNASAGKVLSIWMVFRSVAAAAQSAKGTGLSEKEEERIKGLSAATENFGNFFAQNCFPASASVVLIQSGLALAGYDVTLSDIASSAIYVMIISILLTILQVLLFDKRLKGGKKS